MGIDYAKLKAFSPAPIPAAYTEKDCQFYALAVGVGMDPADQDQLRFVYERDLSALPSMPSVLGWMGRPTDPAYGIDNRKVVAAGICVRLNAPLATSEADLLGHARVAEVYDRGEGGHAIIAFSRELRRSDGTVVAEIDSTIIGIGQGGFGGAATQPPARHSVPEREPDVSVDLPTPQNLALLFRLLGDENPIHVDPALARKAGFERPILHGSATFGVAVHAVLKGALGYDTSGVRLAEGSFVKPVYPGDVLRTEIWRDGRQISFRTSVPARNALVLDNGLIEVA